MKKRCQHYAGRSDLYVLIHTNEGPLSPPPSYLHYKSIKRSSAFRTHRSKQLAAYSPQPVAGQIVPRSVLPSTSVRRSSGDDNTLKHLPATHNTHKRMHLCLPRLTTLLLLSLVPTLVCSTHSSSINKRLCASVNEIHQS